MMFTEPKQHLWTVLPILLSELAYLLSKTMWIGSLNVLLCPATTFQSVILQRIMNMWDIFSVLIHHPVQSLFYASTIDPPKTQKDISSLNSKCHCGNSIVEDDEMLNTHGLD